MSQKIRISVSYIKLIYPKFYALIIIVRRVERQKANFYCRYLTGFVLLFFVIVYFYCISHFFLNINHLIYC